MALIIMFVTVALVDVAGLAGMTGLDAVAHIKEARPDLKRVMVVNEVTLPVTAVIVPHLYKPVFYFSSRAYQVSLIALSVLLGT